MHGARSGTRAAVQKQHRAAAGIARLLPIHDMTVGKRQIAGLEWSYFGKKVAAWHSGKLEPGWLE